MTQCNWGLLSFLCGLFGYNGPPSTPSHPLQQCAQDTGFDFIIIGAGTTGNVIANRLTELNDIKVLVLEAGEEPLHVANIPLIAHRAFHTAMDWNYLSTPQKHCCSIFKNNQIPLTRGKVLGGTSGINYMTATRCNPRDFDAWEEAGNEGWGSKEMFKYFMKLEGYGVPMRKEDEKYHNRSGPMPMQLPPYRTQMAAAYAEAAYELGIPPTDYNDFQNQLGIMYPPATIRNGQRCSTYHAYLQPAMERSNLKVVTNALVTKILFNDNKTAIGVNYETKDKVKCTMKAKREVILSAGAYNSPQVLLLSGVGPQAHLEAMKIPVVLDLPGVGQRLHDHAAVGGMMYTLRQPIGINSARDETRENLNLWETSKIGPMTVPMAFEAISYHKTSATDGPEDWPDLELYCNSDNTQRLFLPFLKYEFKVQIPANKTDVISLHPLLLRPKSRGSVTLQSSNPYDPPLIDPNYLAEEDDVKVLVQALYLIQQYGSTKAFGHYGAVLVNFGIVPQCVFSIVFGLDNYIRCIVKTLSTTSYHPTSTCSMGPANDTMAVVDSKLKVHGLKGLRVADASIMPNVPAGHPQIPCMAVGEKISDVIKDEIAASRKKK